MDTIGLYGVGGMAAYILFQFYYRKTYLFGYIVMIVVNYLLNVTLKRTIQEPRPNAAVYAYSNSHRYGMPSGHMQMITAVLMYYWMAKPTYSFGEWAGLLSIYGVTIAELKKNGKHTWKQMSVGTIIGSVVGWIGYQITKRTIFTR